MNHSQSSAFITLILAFALSFPAVAELPVPQSAPALAPPSTAPWNWPDSEAASCEFAVDYSGCAFGSLLDRSGDISFVVRFWAPADSQYKVKLVSLSGDVHPIGGQATQPFKANDLEGRVFTFKMSNALFSPVDAGGASEDIGKFNEMLGKHILPMLLLKVARDRQLTPHSAWQEERAPRLAYQASLANEALSWSVDEALPESPLVRIHAETRHSDRANSYVGAKEFAMEQYAADAIYDTEHGHVQWARDTYTREWWDFGAPNGGQMKEYKSDSWSMTELRAAAAPRPPGR